MREFYSIRLSEHDLGQILDGLEVRAEAWAKTAEYHRTGESPPDFIAEECANAEEAQRIAAHYRSIIANIREQREVQDE